MKAPHTRGPWEVSPHEMGDFIRCSKGYLITGPINGRPGHEANARLIAAAPDLLAALRPFANFACDVPCQCHNCIARAAIAKATGKGQ